MGPVPGPPRTKPLFYDSGPLLCLGASEVLRPDLDRRFRTSMRIVAAVRAELQRQSTEVLPNGHARSRQVRKKAAWAALEHYEDEFEASVARPDPVPDSLRELEASMHNEGEHESKHRGECESIFHAQASDHGFVTNDGGAARASTRARVTTLTFVDLSRHLLRVNRQLTRDDVAAELIRIYRSGVDTGEQIGSALDL